VSIQVSPAVFDGIDAVAEAVGTHIGYSAWHAVTQERIDAFAHATGDHQWIHVDPVRAATGPFGSTIAHGYLTLSMVPMMLWETFRIEGLTMEVNYGSEKLRFPAPVPVGSEIRAGVELLSLVEVPGGARLTTRVTVELADSAKPACVVEMISHLVPEDSGE
jgi:acyl dehydratase